MSKAKVVPTPEKSKDRFDNLTTRELKVIAAHIYRQEYSENIKNYPKMDRLQLLKAMRAEDTPEPEDEILPTPEKSKDRFEPLRTQELRVLAGNFRIKGCAKMNRFQLLEALGTYEERKEKRFGKTVPGQELEYKIFTYTNPSMPSPKDNDPETNQSSNTENCQVKFQDAQDRFDLLKTQELRLFAGNLDIKEYKKMNRLQLLEEIRAKENPKFKGLPPPKDRFEYLKTQELRLLAESLCISRRTIMDRGELLEAIRAHEERKEKKPDETLLEEIPKNDECIEYTSPLLSLPYNTDNGLVTLQGLKQLAARLHIKGYSQMNRLELLEAISAYEIKKEKENINL